MPRAAWRRHVLEALERREERARCLCGLLERHEKLQGRLETLLHGMGTGADHLLEVIQLRQERQELHQQLAFVTETLARTEVESQEQRARLCKIYLLLEEQKYMQRLNRQKLCHTRMHRLAQDLGALQHQHQGLQCKAWELSRESEGLRRDLDQVRGLLQKAQQERHEMEARWVMEKALEAKRLNWALEQEEKYQWKVSRLREKLQRVRAGAAQTAASEGSSSAPWEEPEMAAAMGQGAQAIPTSTSSPVGCVRSRPNGTGAEV